MEKILLPILACLPFLLPAQYQQPLGDFHQLSVFGNLEVVLQKGDAPALELPEEDRLPERFKMQQSGHKISLRLVPKVSDWDEETVRIVITYVELDELWVHAGAQLTSRQPLEAEEIKLEGTMGARVELEIYADRLEAYATEGGMVELEGSVRSLRAKANTGGELEATALEARRAEARANTGGMVYIWVTDRLKAIARMGGNIQYEGDPTDLDLSSGVAGTVEEY